jgi:hypothetical protein
MFAPDELIAVLDGVGVDWEERQQLAPAIRQRTPGL